MSRLSDVLNELSRSRRMNQPQIVKRSNELGVPLSKGNVSRYLSGKHPETPQIATLTAFAKVFDVPVEDLEDAVAYTGRDPFEAHPSSDLLTPPQRTAVNEIIRLLAEGNKGAAHDRQDDTEPGQEAGSTEHGSEDRREDGSEAGRRQAPMSEDDNVHHLDQGKLQPPPAPEKSAAWRTRNRGKEIRDDHDDRSDD